MDAFWALLILSHIHDLKEPTTANKIFQILYLSLAIGCLIKAIL